MAAFAGIASFVVALYLSYQIFPDPGTGDMGYAGGRFIFTAAVTIIVSVVATRVSKSHREAEYQRLREEARKAQRQREGREAELRETERREVALRREAGKREAELLSEIERLREAKQQFEVERETANEAAVDRDHSLGEVPEEARAAARHSPGDLELVDDARTANTLVAQKSVAPIGASEADEEQDTNVADERAWILRQYSSIDSAVAGQRAFASQSLFTDAAASAGEQWGLHAAVHRSEVVEWLLNGAPIDGVARIEYGDNLMHWETPLLTAFIDGHREVAEALIENGADVDAPNMVKFPNGSGFAHTTLHMLAVRGDNSGVARLIEAGADVNRRTTLGTTPLHFAAREDNSELVEILLRAGANRNVREFDTDQPGSLGDLPVEQAGPRTRSLLTANSHVRRVETASAQSQKDSELPLRAAITATPQLPGFKHLRVIGFSTALKRFAQAVPRGEGGYGLDVEGNVISWESRTGLVSESQNDVYERVRLPARRLAIPGNVVQIAGSRGGMLALTEHGDVYAWGEDYFDETGEDGRNEESPLQINGLAGIVSLASTGSTHFAIGARGEVWSWGSNYGGCLGDGSEANRSVPALVPHLSDVREVRCSEQRDQVVALTTGGAVLVWGYGYSFDGDKVARSIPTELIDLPKIRSLGDGETAIDGDGHVWRWGEDLAVKQVPDLTDIVAIVHGSNSISNEGTWHALDRDGRVYGWGSNNFGQIGDGTTTDRDHPVPVTGLTDVVALVNNSAEAYALTSSGTVCAWGRFPSGRVLENYGNMETIHGPVPQRIPLPHFTESRMQRWATLELASLGSSELRQTFFDFRNGRTPLMQCAAAGLDDEVSVMLAQSGDVNAVDSDGDSALFYAASKGQVRNVELLLRAGANPHIHRPGGISALAQAAGMSVAFGSDGSDYWQVALLLLRRGADPSDMYSRGIAPARRTDRGMLVIRPENLYSYLAYDDTFPIRVVRSSFVG